MAGGAAQCGAKVAAARCAVPSVAVVCAGRRCVVCGYVWCTVCNVCKGVGACGGVVRRQGVTCVCVVTMRVCARMCGV